MLKYKKIVFKISGSIAAFKSCEIISQLVKMGCEVQIITTPSTLKFIGLATLEGLSGRKVFSDLFSEGQMMDHINLNRWADAVILCPASANTINQLACGVGDDAVKALFLAHDRSKPYFIVPAMNTKMWEHPITKASIEKLVSIGAQILGPQSGSLACGDIGEGRMLEVHEVIRLIQSNSLGPRVLITGGGTSEPIDSVRSITNTSTGATAAQIAEELISRGAQVTYLKAEKAALPKIPCINKSFVTFSDLQKLLFSELSQEEYDFIIHAAAVSDFSPANKIKTKLESGEEIIISLKPNPKLINNIKEISKNKAIKLIGFKLTDTTEEEQVQKSIERLFNQANADWVVQNSLADVTPVKHIGRVYNRTQKSVEFSTKKELAQKISEIVFGGTK